MSDRIVMCICPHCNEEVEVFVMIGQTFTDVCEECGKTIYFDDYGEIYISMNDSELKQLEKERDEYYSRLSKRYDNVFEEK